MSSGYPPEWGAVSLRVKLDAGFRCVRCGHPNGRWSRPGNDHLRAAFFFAVKYIAPDKPAPTVHPVDGGGAWLQHHLFPCDEHCTHATSLNAAGQRDNLSAHRILTVHHLDGVKTNLAWWNLAALCQRCHLTIQGRVHLEQTWLFPHSIWFRPYVAGYYAFKVLGLELTRAEIESDLVKYLIAGQPTLEELYTEGIG